MPGETRKVFRVVVGAPQSLRRNNVIGNVETGLDAFLKRVLHRLTVPVDRQVVFVLFEELEALVDYRS